MKKIVLVAALLLAGCASCPPAEPYSGLIKDSGGRIVGWSFGPTRLQTSNAQNRVLTLKPVGH